MISVTSKKMTNTGVVVDSEVVLHPIVSDISVKIEVGAISFLEVVLSENFGFIKGLEEVNGVSYKSNRIGDFLELKCINKDNNTWQLINGKGIWRASNGKWFNLNEIAIMSSQANIAQSDLPNSAATDVSGLNTWINSNLVPLVNAIKKSQNDELNNQRRSGHQSTV